MQMNNANENEVEPQRLHMAWTAYKAGDYSTAVKEFSTLAEEGCAHAWLNLGWLHNNGFGVPKNFSKAKTCYTKAISLGSVDALIPLGLLYKQIGEPEKSFDCFLRAANKEYLPGIYRTGRAYLYGEGIEKNIEKAKIYLTAAMGRGHAYASIDYRAAQIKGVFGGVQRIAGMFGMFKAFAMAVKAHRSEPYGDRMR